MIIKIENEISKACSTIDLFGYLHSRTNDWIDGLFTSIFRDMNISPIEQEVNLKYLSEIFDSNFGNLLINKTYKYLQKCGKECKIGFVHCHNT